MLRPYQKIGDWDLIFRRAVKAVSSPGVHSPWIDKRSNEIAQVDTMYDLLNELVKQIATATEGNYTNSSILFKLPKQPKIQQ